LSGPLLCRAQGRICDGNALIQAEAVVDRAEGELVHGGQSIVTAATSGGEFRAGAAANVQTAAAAQTATVHAAETRTGDSGYELGRDLFFASLDQPEIPDDFMDDKSWAPPPTRNIALIKTGGLEEPRVSPLQLTATDRLYQMMPIFVVMALGFRKLRENVGMNAASMSARSITEVAVCLALYCVSGPAIILLNKHIMRAHKFHFPILLASLGNVFLLIVTRASVALGWQTLEVEHLSWDRYLKVAVPINIFNFLAQTLGMYPFMFISVPQIQILKSTTIVMVLLFAWLFVNEKVNKLLVGSILVISAGVCVSAVFDGDSMVGGDSGVSHTLIGVTLMVLSCACEAAKTVISQVLIDKMPLFDVLYHSSPSFVLLATVFVGCMEGKRVYHYDFNGTVVGLLVANALTTGVIVFSSFWFVKLAGALTLKVVTQARSVGLILCSVVFFGEVCSGPQYVGLTLTLVGMGMFDHAKQVLREDAATVGPGGRSRQGKAIKGETQSRS
jgi:drug/metabolite transporter (DMT)-like permease